MRAIVSAVLILSFSIACVSSTQPRVQKISVNTDPAGAKVWTELPGGMKVIGKTPTIVEGNYEMKATEFDSTWWWGVLGSAVLVGIGGGMAGYGNSGGDESIDDVGRDPALGAGGLALVGVGLGTAAIQTLIYTIAEFSDVDLSVVGKPELSFGVKLDGYKPVERTVGLPHEHDEINFMLKKDLVKATPPPENKTRVEKVVPIAPKVDPIAPKEGPRRQIVAVFDIEDVKGILEKDDAAQLTMYLGTALTTTGLYNTIPRDQLRARLLDEKAGSYKECRDESCQIELGKTLSAQKTLSTQLLKVGKKCAVTANLYDLKTETAEKGAMVNTGCSSDELLDAMKQVADQLSSK